MKYRTISLLAFIFYCLFQFLLLSSLASSSNNKRKASSLEFFKQFQGTQKGDHKVKGIHALKQYLQTLGYLEHIQQESHVDKDVDDKFDENLESAIKMFQINYNLNPTGTLDLKTVSTMAKPRCGVPDIISGTTRMRSGSAQYYNLNISKRFHSDFAFFPRKPKWPLTKKVITYGFQPGTRADVHEPVRIALLQWSNHVPFTFQGTDDYNKADIKISFQRRDHGDGFPFDGPGQKLAHAFSPTDGRYHYDADETWVLGAVPGGFDMMTVALHELGHVMGLRHSSVEDAIMWPLIQNGATKGLNDDDITGIKILYGSSECMIK